MSFSDELEPLRQGSELQTLEPGPDRIFAIDFPQVLEQLALPVAQAWRDDNPEAHLKTDFNHCVEFVTTEMLKAGTAVGGPAGLEIVTGGGSIAACKACRQVFPD